MDFTVTNNIFDQLGPLRQARPARAFTPSEQKTPGADNDNLPAVVNKQTGRAYISGTKIVSEQRQDTADGGYRLTRTFEKEDGRRFSKVEEFGFTDRGTRKTVVQQNPSGSISVYEEVLDREDTGNFRRTQRFQDGTGDVATTITQNYTVTDPFILMSGQNIPAYQPYTPFEPTRGTQLDLRA